MQISDIQGTTTLHNGVQMPYFGLGVWQSKEGDEVVNAVKYALDAGYRHIDTAAVYRNEAGVGKAIAEHNIDRAEVFITSKVWNADQGYDKTLKAFEASLQLLDMDYLDLYLVHWPVKGKYKDTWKALETLYNEGRVKAIGVSNFLQHHLEDLMGSANIIPMVDQLEFHPILQQPSLVNFCKAQGIQYEAWSPIMQGRIGQLAIINEIATKHHKTAAQVALRWDLQQGVVTIPKSVKQHRIIENAQIFDFQLDAEDMERIDALDKAERLGPDPDNFNF